MLRSSAASGLVLATQRLGSITGRALAFPLVILRIWVAALFAALAFVTAAHAAATPPPPVLARAFIVENAATGEVLAQHGAWTRVPIASLTKLMTVIVALDHARWNAVVRVRADAAAVGESTVHLRAGSTWSRAGLSLVPLQGMLPCCWIASTKPKAALDRSKAGLPC